MKSGKNVNIIYATMISVVSMLIGTLGEAATRTWIGGDANWTVASQWGGTVPTSVDDVIIDGGSGSWWDITLQGDVTIASLYVRATGGGSRNIWIDLNGYNLTVTGDMTMLSGGSTDQNYMDLRNGTLTIGGTLYHDLTGSGVTNFVGDSPGSSTIVFNGTMNIGTGGASSATPPNVQCNASGAQTMERSGIGYYFYFEDLTVGTTNTPIANFNGVYGWGFVGTDGSSDITVKAGATMKISTTSCESGSTGGTVTLNAGSTLELAGTADWPGYDVNSGYGTYIFDKTSEVKYTGSGATLRALGTYGKLNINSASTISANANINCDGNVTLRSMLNMSTYNLNIEGAWDSDGDNFTASTGTVIFDGSTTEAIANSGTVTVLSNATTLLAETFSSAAIPTGWTNQNVTGSSVLSYPSSSSNPTGFSPTVSSNMVRFNSYTCANGNIRRLYTGSFASTGKSNLSVAFDWSMDNQYSASNDFMTVQYSTNGSTWTSAGTVYRYAAADAWTSQSINLPAGADNQATLYVAFLFESEYGNDCHMDNVVISGYTSESYSGGLIPKFQLNKTSGAGVTLSNKLMISTSATFTAGDVTSTSTNFIEFDEDATVSGASNSSHVVGEVVKRTNTATQFTFPTGDGSSLLSAAITPSSSNATTWTVKYFGTGYGTYTMTGSNIAGVKTNEYWTIDRAGGTPANGTILLNWNAASSIADYTDMCVAHWNTGASAWETTDVDAGNTPTGNNSAGTISSDAAWSSFSPFVLATKSSALPIELLDFISYATEDKTVISEWITATELNNDYFTIESSANGIDFESIGITDGAGTSSTKMYYEYVDYEPKEGISYYRLKQTDFDGHFSYSDIVAVQMENGKIVDMSVYPNPVHLNSGQAINMKITGLSEDQEILVVLVDVTGRQVYSKVLVTNNDGSSYSAIDPVGKLKSGMYTVIGSSENEMFSKKLIVE